MPAMAVRQHERSNWAYIWTFMAIYLDNAATTLLDGRVIRFIDSIYKHGMANPSSQHRAGIRAAVLIENARQLIARSIHAEPDEIYFFSSGTEVNNTVLHGVACVHKKRGSHIVVSSIEHPSILEQVRWLQKHGLRVSYVKVDRHGLVDPGDVAQQVTSKTILVSVMHANNEIGTIQPVKALGQFCRKKGVYFHTDASQSFTKVPIDVRKDHLDLVTLNSHKIHGPKGIAALYIRKGVEIDPLIHGGHQENGMRAGTYNTEGIAGFGKAVEIVDQRDIVRMRSLRDQLIRQIESNVPGAVLNGSRHKRLCNNVNFSFQGVKGKELLSLLNKKNIYVSTGSACFSNTATISYVLQALGVGQQQADGAIRMTLSKWTTKKEIDVVVRNIISMVAGIRRKA